MSVSNGSAGVAGEDMGTSRVRAWVDEAQRVVVLTGAGISTDSGIPDFRGPNGVWTKNPEAEKAATIQHYLADPDVRVRAWQTRIASPAWAARPNPGHQALVDLERRRKLLAIVTQNVDELHQRAGSSPGLVVEVHGTMFRTKCWDCEEERPMDETLERVRAGEADPPCASCGGILKSATISFGQPLVPEVIDRALQVAEEADLLLAIGTTLAVYPVANMVPRARFAGAKVVIVNAEPTGYDDVADAVLRGSISEILPAITTDSR